MSCLTRHATCYGSTRTPTATRYVPLSHVDDPATTTCGSPCMLRSRSRARPATGKRHFGAMHRSHSGGVAEAGAGAEVLGALRVADLLLGGAAGGAAVGRVGARAAHVALGLALLALALAALAHRRDRAVVVALPLAVDRHEGVHRVRVRPGDGVGAGRALVVGVRVADALVARAAAGRVVGAVGGLADGVLVHAHRLLARAALRGRALGLAVAVNQQVHALLGRVRVGHAEPGGDETDHGRGKA